MEDREIIGNTTTTPNPCPDWAQKDDAKADYIKNKPETLPNPRSLIFTGAVTGIYNGSEETIIEINTLKGDPGDDYVLNDDDITEIANRALELMEQAEDMSV